MEQKKKKKTVCVYMCWGSDGQGENLWKLKMPHDMVMRSANRMADDTHPEGSETLERDRKTPSKGQNHDQCLTRGQLAGTLWEVRRQATLAYLSSEGARGRWEQSRGDEQEEEEGSQAGNTREVRL
jgi:hypothetical protein